MVDAPIVLGLVAVALLLAAIVVLKGGAKEEPAPSAAPAAAAAPAAPPAPNGRLQVFFGSQTGTAPADRARGAEWCRQRDQWSGRGRRGRARDGGNVGAGDGRVRGWQ